MEIDESGAKSAECLNGGKDRAEEVEKQWWNEGQRESLMSKWARKDWRRTRFTWIENAEH